MTIKARSKKPTRPAKPGAIEWPRADPAALDEFDPSTKTCTMNCSPHGLDPRSREERKFLCDDCEPYHPSVHEQLQKSLAREAALRAELKALRAAPPNA